MPEEQEKSTAQVLKEWIIRKRGYYITPKKAYHKWIAYTIFAVAIGLIIFKLSQ